MLFRSTLFDVARRQRGGGGERSVFISMGEAGIASRILAGRFGSAWTYAGPVSGVGQLRADELLDGYRFRSLGDATQVYAVVGSPIAHSVSPAMHNAAFQQAGLDAVYLPLKAASPDDFLQFAAAMGVRGASVTIPFKVALFERMDEVTDAGRRAGAINTIRIEVDGRRLGDNTDAAGFLRPLRDRQVALDGARVSVLGAGGSARAVAVSLASMGAHVTIHARRLDSARAVAEHASADIGPWPPARGSWDMLVNCTPVGMHPHVEETPLSRDGLTGQIGRAHV